MASLALAAPARRWLVAVDLSATENNRAAVVVFLALAFNTAAGSFTSSFFCVWIAFCDGPPVNPFVRQSALMCIDFV